MKKTEKLGRIDIKATINKKQVVNIEIQLKDNHNMDKRTEYYGAKLMAEQLGKGEKYETLKPVILINILDYEMLDIPEYCTKTVTVAEKHRDYEVIKDVTYWFIELPKFRKSKPKLANLLECWLALIDDDRGLIKMAEEKNEIIKEANEEVEEILSDEELKAWNDYLFTAELEENSRKYQAEVKGREKGLKQGLEEGRKQGFEQGIEQGIKRGIECGKKEEKIEMAKEMLKLGMRLEEISKITKLSIEEIRKIDKK